MHGWRDWISFFVVTAISFTQKSGSPSGKMRASHWKTSKRPPFPRHMSRHSLLTSAGKGHLPRSLRATSCARDWERVHMCMFAHVTASCCCYRNLPFKSPSHTIGDSLEPEGPWDHLVHSAHCNQDETVSGCQTAAPERLAPGRPLRARSLWFCLSHYFRNLFPPLFSEYL